MFYSYFFFFAYLKYINHLSMVLQYKIQRRQKMEIYYINISEGLQHGFQYILVVLFDLQKVLYFML